MDSLDSRTDPPRIAQTNLQLYKQFRAEHRAPEELALVKRAYDLVAILYSGYYQADGKPFTAHGVGVASILGHLDLPADFLATGLLHNVYGNADFGDGRNGVINARRRRLVRDSVGERVESLVARFPKYRITPHSIDRVGDALDRMDAEERNLVVIDLADYLEKYVDLGVLFFGDNRWMTEKVDRYGDELVALARRLNHDLLANLLAEAFEEAARAAPLFPSELRSSPDRRYLALTVPRSCRRRFFPWVQHVSQPLRSKARLRSRLRVLRDRPIAKHWSGL